MNYKILKTAQLIKVLYDSDDGATGGYGHIVFDDDNLETTHIEWCIEEAVKDEYDLSKETRVASIYALQSMLELNIKEREQANNYYWNNLRKIKP